MNENREIISREELIQIFDTKYRNLADYPNSADLGISTKEHFSRYFILPEYGDISPNGRAVLIFRQLLDLAREDSYSDMLPNYALSLLGMEISQEFIESFFKKDNREPNPKMEEIVEWVSENYARRLSMDDIAKNFKYNADYLSTAFRRYTGIPLMKYIRKVRIDNAKKQLLNTTDSIKEIASKMGFEDDKSFMKQFKQMTDITPTAFRSAFPLARY